MPKTSSAQAAQKIDEGALTKGQLRKLNALRKSVGEDIGDKAFGQWLTTQDKASKKGAPVDRTAQMIEQALIPLLKRKSFSIPRGGYIVSRGRGRFIITPAR